MLLIVMFASGAAELLSLGAVLPFLMVLSDPELLWQHFIVQYLASWLGLPLLINYLYLQHSSLVFCSIGGFDSTV